MAEAKESIKVTPENWRRLNARKEPGDSFNDVVARLLDEHESELTVD